MASLKDLLKQKDELDAQIEALRKAEVSNVISQIRALMAEYQLSVMDIASDSGARAPKTRKSSSVAPKYRDPVSGATWSGRGRSPTWLQGRDKSEFLIGS
jgi:DNA-binding protein H-NS